jgi:hypothetical protein
LAAAFACPRRRAALVGYARQVHVRRSSLVVGKDRLVERGGSAAVAAHPVEHPEERDGGQRHQAGRPREREGDEAERREDRQRDERPPAADPVGADALGERGRRRARKPAPTRTPIAMAVRPSAAR